MDALQDLSRSTRANFRAGSRNSYDSAFKLRVIAFAKDHDNSQAGRKFGVSECNVRRWRTQEEKFKLGCRTRKTFRGPKKGRHPLVDEEVATFVKELRQEGMPVTRENIQIKAAQVARKLGLRRTDFKASLGWVRRFMKRSGLALRRRTTLAQRLPADYEEKLIAYQRYVVGLRQLHDHHISQIGNADQTPVFLDMPSNTTVDAKGVKSVMIRTAGCEKQRCTVMLAVTGDGFKLPPYVIFKRKTFPKNLRFPRGIVVRVQEKGWMTENLVLDWLKNVWEKRPGALLNMRGLLSLDAFRGHLTAPVKAAVRDANTDLVIVPGGMTSQLQVLDVSVNKPFKDYLRKEYHDWLIDTDHQLTPTGKIKRPELPLVCEWILSAWRSIKPEIIVHGFKKCCLTNAMDGSEDDVLWEDEDLPSESSDEEESSVSSSDSECSE